MCLMDQPRQLEGKSVQADLQIALSLPKPIGVTMLTVLILIYYGL